MGFTLLLNLLICGLLATDHAVAEKLSAESLQTSLQLGTQFLLNNQKPEGNFQYLYDWRTRLHSNDDDPTRQAGATWGLALIHAQRPSEQTEDALRRALAFMNRHSRRSHEGWRYIVYPGEKVGNTGTVALVALAHLEYLRVLDDAGQKFADGDAYSKYRELVDGYLQFLVRMRSSSGLWRSHYHNLTGSGSGTPSPYYDGEALLALVKAAKYHGFDGLRPSVLDSARAGYTKYVTEARQLDPDSALTKGYYQWSSMALFELATSDWEDTDEFGDHVIDLADWMIDVHKTLERTRNTAYAYEGIIHAYQLAKLRNDQVHVDKFERVISQGLAQLTSWQVGHPLANQSVRQAGTDDLHAVGGIQNHRRESSLRIDVTQHQMHAVMLALKYCFSAPTLSDLERLKFGKEYEN